MFELLWIALIVGAAYLLFVWVPAYFRKRKQRSEREILDLTFKEGPTDRPGGPGGPAVEPQSISRIWILRGMVAIAVVLVIAALASRSVDLVYVIIFWIIPMLIVNNFPRIIRWIKNLH